MNKAIILLCMVLTLLVVSCAAPPEDVPSAVVVEENPNPEDVEVDGSEDSEADSVEETDASSDSETGDVEVMTKVIDTATSSFEFEGYGPGKSHIGTFDEWSGTMTFEGDTLVAAEGVIKASSVNTGIGGLDTHLKSDDFFDVEVHPNIVISSTEIEEETVYADLTFHGVTKNIQFPVTQSNGRLSADFLLDITDFNLKYTGINSEVRITFEFAAEE